MISKLKTKEREKIERGSCYDFLVVVNQLTTFYLVIDLLLLIIIYLQQMRFIQKAARQNFYFCKWNFSV